MSPSGTPLPIINLLCNSYMSLLIPPLLIRMVYVNCYLWISEKLWMLSARDHWQVIALIEKIFMLNIRLRLEIFPLTTHFITQSNILDSVPNGEVTKFIAGKLEQHWNTIRPRHCKCLKDGFYHAKLFCR